MNGHAFRGCKWCSEEVIEPVAYRGRRKVYCSIECAALANLERANARTGNVSEADEDLILGQLRPGKRGRSTGERPAKLSAEDGGAGRKSRAKSFLDRLPSEISVGASFRNNFSLRGNTPVMSKGPDCGRQIANEILRKAVDDMFAAGIPIAVVVDRLLTYGAGYAATSDGKDHTAASFRTFADTIEAGLFDSFAIPLQLN